MAELVQTWKARDGETFGSEEAANEYERTLDFFEALEGRVLRPRTVVKAWETFKLGAEWRETLPPARPHKAKSE